MICPKEGYYTNSGAPWQEPMQFAQKANKTTSIEGPLWVF